MCAACRTDCQSVQNTGRISNPSYGGEFTIGTRRQSLPRAGHTLFEILLALGLSLVLLVAVYSALDIHWKFSAAGRERMERSQVARALLEKLHGDIRDVVFRDEEISAREKFELSKPQQAGEGSSIRVTRPGDDFVSRNVGLIGSSERLLLQVSRSSSTRISTTAVPDSPATSVFEPSVKDQRFVYWQFVENGTQTISTTTLAGQRNASTASRLSSNSTSGLARFETNLAAAIAADLTGTQSESFDNSNIIAHEVRGIRFRYFDGIAWHDAWDSVVIQRLPRAVEVTIRFRPADVSATRLGGSALTDDYRQVILMPLSEPILNGGES